MLNLEPISGLPMHLDDKGHLLFGPEVMVQESKVRLLDELTPVALAPEVCRGSREVVYDMYNGVYRESDAPHLDGVPLRYELTLMPPRRLGREFVKTLGHLHAPEPRSGLGYAEICEVLVGVAHFLFQTLDPSGPDAPLAFYVEARAGQKVLIPPGLDHLTINPGPEPLLFSDVIALGVTGIYDRFKSARGAAYLEVSENGQPRFIPNPHYRAVAPLHRMRLKEHPELDLTDAVPLYTAFVRNKGRNWPFLTDPCQFGAFFPELAALGKT